MATVVTVNSNYAGTVAGQITGKAFKEADTLRLGLLTVLPDVDFQVSLISSITKENSILQRAC